MTRERREALTHAYVGTRDGYLAARLGADKVFEGGAPLYAREEAPVRTGEDLYRDYAHRVKQRSH